MYDLIKFGRMILDSVRTDAYYEALKQVVGPDSIVIDLGAGTGIFSLMACQLGAQRVYAIEPNEWIELGKKIAIENGYADRIVFIKDLSTDISLPEQGDVVIGDLRGPHPLVGPNILSTIDARRRFLKPGGILIPRRDIVYASLITAPQLYQKRVIEPWQQNAYALDMNSATNFVVNSMHIISSLELTEFQALPEQVFADLDYRVLDNPNVHTNLEWTIAEPCTLHFILLWFDAQVSDNLSYTTAPLKKRAKIYGYLLLPFTKPLDCVSGDNITLELKANLVNKQYIFSWNTSVRENDRNGKIKAEFQQSTFFSTLFSNMHKHAGTFVPNLTPRGQIARFVLNRMTNSDSLETIAAKVFAEFPNEYNNVKDALAYVSSLSEHYSE